MRNFFVALTLAALLQSGRSGGQQFINGLAQPIFADQTVIRHNVWVEVPGLDSDRDGVNDRMRVQINRPQATESGTKLPIILSVSPYSGGTLPYPRHDMDVELYVPDKRGRKEEPATVTRPGDPPRPYYGTDGPIPDIRASSYQSYFLPRGFIFAYANSLGTGHSTGCPTIGGIEENLAVKAVIDWFNGKGKGYDADGNPVQPYWTTGSTSMIGVSYDGTLPIGAATLGVEGLKAIVPIAGVSSYYDHRRSHGAVINSFPTMGTDADTLFDNILSRKYPEACGYMRARIARGKDRETGDYNAFWDERNYVKDVGRAFRAAVLIAHGLNDFNTKPRHAARLWEALKAHHIPAKIWWNQGGHGDRANSARQAIWRDTLNQFWSHHLYGVDNGAMDGSKVTIERENNVWVDYADWPVPGAAATTLNPTAGDAPNGIGHLGLERPKPGRGIVEVIVDDSSIDATALAADPNSPNRLVYRSRPLVAPVHISGMPAVSLRLSFSKPAAIVSAMLIDYRADGTTTIVTRGWADPQNRQSLSKTAAIDPGAFYTITFELQPHDYVFQPGSRVGLMLLSSDRLFTQRPAPGTRLTLQTTRSTFMLPVVGGAKAFATAVREGKSRGGEDEDQPREQWGRDHHDRSPQQKTAIDLRPFMVRGVGHDQGADRGERHRVHHRRRDRQRDHQTRRPDIAAHHERNGERDHRAQDAGARGKRRGHRTHGAEEQRGEERTAQPGDAVADRRHGSVALQGGHVRHDPADEQYDAPGDLLLGSGTRGKEQLEQDAGGESHEPDAEPEHQRRDSDTQ